jgi:SAM-dependent methyltransferase
MKLVGVAKQVLDPEFAANFLLRREMLRASTYAAGTLIDVGCGLKPYREIMRVQRYVGIDIPSRHAQVDVWGDALCLPLRDGCADTVLCNEVLEHVPDPRCLLREVHRILKPDGHLLLTAPQTWGLHLIPNDFYRFTGYGLMSLAQQCGFEVVYVEPTCGFWATIGQRLADVVYYTYAASASQWFKRLLRVPCATAALLGLALDELVGKRGDTLDNVLVARRA